MRIGRLRINHMENPMGYMLKTVTASYEVLEAEGGQQTKARVMVSKDIEFTKLCFDTGISQEVSGLGTPLLVVQEPETRYFWKVRVWDDCGAWAESDTAWFETGLGEGGFEGISITPVMNPAFPPVLEKEFFLEENTERARLYICGLGIFEAYLNGIRVGDEMLTPYLTAYHSYVQYLTFDTGELLQKGRNILRVFLGDGWYKGLYGYRQNEHYRDGRNFELLLQMHITGKQGKREKVVTDLTWRAGRSSVTESDIYNGETVDDTILQSCEEGDICCYPVCEGALKQERVGPRLSVPVRVKEIICPEAVILTPRGETVIDMGQNMVGWLSFRCRGEKGQKIILEHGEILQDGSFYRDNYRTARAVFTYISGGMEKQVRPAFTFFGFRYVKVTSDWPVTARDFQGEVVYSDLERTGTLSTGNELINRLISNITWSQKGNFLDIPTDCPQRDERLGWTGDAQIFAGTASLNMECYPFFRKYMEDVRLEQERAGGMVPQLVPNVDRSRKTSAAWGDAAMIIPWIMYRTYGDASILMEQYESMCAWIAYIDSENERCHTNPRLWQNGFHYGDWLALDGGYYHMPTGGTEVFFISSAYFYHSVDILSKTAAVLGKKQDAAAYAGKAGGIREAIRREYFSPAGRMCMDTQTGYCIAIQFGLYDGEAEKKRLAEGLVSRIRRDGYQLTTGFVGTPFLLWVLSECGRMDLAYRILLDRKCPGWLYPVTMGATTVWERWDSVRPDGHMSDNGMNSLNHYANGSVMEWMYGIMAGIRQKEDSAGYGKVRISPGIHSEIGWADTCLHTAAGIYTVAWKIIEENRLWLRCEIPFGAEAEVCLPFAVKGTVQLRKDGSEVEDGQRGQISMDEESYLCSRGSWEWEYSLDKSYISHLSLDLSVRELVRYPQVKKYLYSNIPMLEKTGGAEIQNLTLPEMSGLPFFLGIGTKLGLEQEVLRETEEFLQGIQWKGIM